MTTPVPVPIRPACVSRLRIAGFKSFADPVALDILPGLTGLVGPNGCGKSNVVDALRWAMGEGNARTLRGAQLLHYGLDRGMCSHQQRIVLGYHTFMGRRA